MSEQSRELLYDEYELYREHTLQLKPLCVMFNDNYWSTRELSTSTTLNCVCQTHLVFTSPTTQRFIFRPGFVTRPHKTYYPVVQMTGWITKAWTILGSENDKAKSTMYFIAP